MQKTVPLTELFCPSTGQPCIRNVPVFERSTTLRRWTGGNVKATTCSLECSEQWASAKGYIAIGVSETYDGKTKKTVTIVIVQHPDQVSGNVKAKLKK